MFLTYDHIKRFLTTPAKRVRPLLAVLVAQSLGAELTNEVYNAALSVEYVHNSTLVHDDFMDGDEWRRGEKTIHEQCKEHFSNDKDVRFPNFTNKQTANAIGEATLIGNILYSWGIETLLNFEGPQKTLATQTLVQAYEIINQGQVLDFSNGFVANWYYTEMAGRKTAQLFQAAAMIGAYLGGESKKTAEQVSKAIKPASIAFQIQDDILDMSPTREAKQGSDIKNGRMNMVISQFYSRVIDSKRRKELSIYLSKKACSKEEIEDAIDILVTSGAVYYAEETRDQLFNSSVHKIQQLPIPPHHQTQLIEYAHALTYREK